jgi:6-phosphogluconolactonase
LPVREGNSIGTLTAGLTVFRMDGDGRLELARKYDVETGGRQQFWSGMLTLP